MVDGEVCDICCYDGKGYWKMEEEKIVFISKLCSFWREYKGDL